MAADPTDPVIASVPRRRREDPNRPGPRGNIEPNPMPRIPGEPNPGKLPGMKTPHLPSAGPANENVGPA